VLAEIEKSGVLPPPQLQRQDAHADQVGAVDALEALGDDGADAEQLRPLAAQSREEPEPYSLPARTTSGTPRSAYARGVVDGHLLAVGSRR
jgi:hypothetical protein